MSGIDVTAREAESVRETPYGSVGIVHEGHDLKAWWIWKDAEDVDPVLAVCDREDLIYVIQGSVRLELEGRGAARPRGRRRVRDPTGNALPGLPLAA
jgi:hypothetical protein